MTNTWTPQEAEIVIPVIEKQIVNPPQYWSAPPAVENWAANDVVENWTTPKTNNGMWSSAVATTLPSENEAVWTKTPTRLPKAPVTAPFVSTEPQQTTTIAISDPTLCDTCQENVTITLHDFN